MSRYLPVQTGAKLVILVVAAAAVIACGIKGPPVPPDRTPPVAVQDLHAVVDGEQIRMSWGVPKAATEGKNGLRGFYVFRWRYSLDEPACPDCPRVFERIADVDVQSGQPDADGRLNFSLESDLQAGYRYAFKVIGYAGGNLRSKDSNVLNFDY
jgi:hypothetical protein